MGNPLVQPDLGLYIWTIVTFLLLLWAFNKLAWTPLKAMLQAREDTIRKSLDDARQAREEMQRLKNESAQILAGARAEADTIIARTREDASRFRDELKVKAQAEAATIVKNAEQRIEMETARALQQIRAEAVEFSVAIASKILQRNVSKEDNERLIEETFRQIQSTRPS
jgi:F-type H+-transporting ATPase subunit b